MPFFLAPCVIIMTIQSWGCIGGEILTIFFFFTFFFHFHILPHPNKQNVNDDIDLKTLVKHLENPKYSTVLYVSDGYGSRRRNISTFVVKSNKKESENEREKEEEEINNGSNKMPTTASDTGFCDTISTQYTELYNKNVLFWPCPKMKVSFNRFLCYCYNSIMYYEIRSW